MASEYIVYEAKREKREETAAEKREIADIRVGGFQKEMVAGDNNTKIQEGKSGGEVEPQHDIQSSKN